MHVGNSCHPALGGRWLGAVQQNGLRPERRCDGAVLLYSPVGVIGCNRGGSRTGSGTCQRNTSSRRNPEISGESCQYYCCSWFCRSGRSIPDPEVTSFSDRIRYISPSAFQTEENLCIFFHCHHLIVGSFCQGMLPCSGRRCSPVISCMLSCGFLIFRCSGVVR